MQLLKIGKGTLQKLVEAVLVTTPHRMATERAVSHYNIIRSTRRQAMSEATVNKRLLVSANGVGTLHWDQRPAVAAFLTKKKSRRE